MELPAYVQAFVALLSITNPVAAIPLFLAFTADHPDGRRRVALVASLSVGAVLAGSLLLGDKVLALFGITIDAFRIAGGIVVFLVGLAMLQSSQSRVKQTPEEHREGVERENPAVVPLAIPLLSGPGAISTAIVFGHSASGPGSMTVLTLICGAVAACTWACLCLGGVIAARTSVTALNIVSRLMGLITAAVAVQMVLTGLANALPGLRGPTP